MKSSIKHGIGRFLDYVKIGHNVIKESLQINEGMSDFKDLVWKNVDPNTAIMFLRTLPGHDAQAEHAEWSAEAKDKAAYDRIMLVARNTLGEDAVNKMFSLKSEASESDTINIDIEVPEGTDTEKYASLMYSTMMRIMGKFKLDRSDVLGRNNKTVSFKAGKDLKVCWLAKRLFTNKNIANACQTIIAAQTSKAEKSQLKQLGQNLESVINKEITAADEPPADERSKFSVTHTSSGYKFVVSGSYYDVKCAAALVNAVMNNPQDGKAADIIDTISTRYFGQEDATRQPVYDIDPEIVPAGIRLTGSLSQKHRELLRLFNADAAKTGDNWKSYVQVLIEKTEDSGIKSAIESFAGKLHGNSQKDLAIALHEILFGMFLNRYEKLMSVNKSLKNPYDGKSFSSLLELVGAVSDAVIPKSSAVEQQKLIEAARRATEAQRMRTSGLPDSASAVAKRRWKLFDSAAYYGAKVFVNGRFTLAIVDRDRQRCVFGRNKPKTDRNGQIIENANLRDDEMQALGLPADEINRLKAIRDGNSSDYVKDGINPLYDRTGTETCWCCCGAYDNHGGGTEPSHWGRTYVSMALVHYAMQSAVDRKYLFNIVIMDNANGQLYMYSPSSNLSEHDDAVGLADRKYCSANPPYGTNYGAVWSYMYGLRTAFKEIDEILKCSGLDEMLYGKQQDEETVQSVAARLVSDGYLDASGCYTLGNINNIGPDAKIIAMATKIRLAPHIETSNLISHMPADIQRALPPIDLQDVTSASGLFKDASVGKVILLNMGKRVTDVRDMFSNCVIGIGNDYDGLGRIDGLDTSKVTDASCMLFRCVRPVFKAVEIPELDMGRCKNISYAFQGSYLKSINLKNTDRITNATDAFIECPMLEKMPDIRFKSVNSRGLRSTDDFNPLTNMESVFDGCDTLIGKKEFDEGLNKAIQFYHRSLGEAEVDERGYIKISSAEQVKMLYQKFYKVPGVVLTKDAPTYNLFSDIDGLKIGDLDLNGAEDVAELFYNCKQLTIKKISGSENVKTARSMFYKCSINIMPRLDLPRLSGAFDVLYGMEPFKNASRPDLITFGPGVNSIDADNPENMARALFGSSAANWLKLSNINIALDNIFNIPFRKVLEKAADSLNIDENGCITITVESAAAIAPLPRQVINQRVKKIKFAEDAVILLNTPGSNKTRAEFIKTFQQILIKTNGTVEIDLSNVTNGEYLFSNIQTTSDLQLRNTEKLVIADCMFYRHANRVKTFDVSNVKTAIRMFEYSGGLYPGETWNFTSLTVGQSMFQSIINEPIQPNLIKTPVLTDAQAMFSGSKIADNSSIDMPKAIDCTGMMSLTGFSRNSGVLENVSLPSAKTVRMMFWECDVIKIRNIDISSAENASGMFARCGRIQSIDNLKATKLTDMSKMFSDTPSLRRIGGFESSANNTSGMFAGSLLGKIYGDDGQYFIAWTKRPR